MSLGKQIVKYRKSKNYSQQDLAKQLNVSRQTISRWESDLSVPSIEKINQICNVFKISIDELLESKTRNNIDTKQVMSLINQLNTNHYRIYNKFHRLFKSSVLVIGFIVLILITYTFLSNDYNQNKLLKIEKQTQELNNQLINQQQIFKNIEYKMEEIMANSPVKDYLITFSDVTDDSTNITVKAWLQSYHQDYKVVFNVEDIHGKKYYIPAKLENDYYICEPYTIDLADIEKISVEINNNNQSSLEYVCGYIDISDYTKLNFTSISVSGFAYTSGASDSINIDFNFGMDLNKPKRIETQLNLDKAYAKFYVNNQLAFKQELEVFKGSEPTPHWPYVLYQFKNRVAYNLNPKESFYIEVILVDNYGKETIYRSSEFPNNYGRFNITDMVMEEVEE